MRRTLLLLVIVITVLVIPVTGDRQLRDRGPSQLPFATVGDRLFAAAAGGTGTSSTSTQFMSRTLTSQRVSVVNTYGATTKHNGTLDLAQYSLPGWILYKVTMDIKNITANLEREVLGITPKTGTQEFLIDEVLTDVFSNQLTQAFYNQPHNGSLSNYTIRYYDFGYDESTYGYAFFEVRSSYSDNTTRLTTRTNLTHKGTYGWATFTGNNADLTKNTLYWAMIDGSNLQKVSGNYPHIYWSYEDAAGTFNTGQHISSWLMNRPYEALLNYTYTPWNRTTTSPLVYRQPQTIAFRANSTPLVSSSSWTFSSPSSITLIRFDSNQSVNVYHNLTLWYQKTSSASVSWKVPSPGSPVNWNSTTTVSYPSTTGLVSRFLNISKMSDWVPTGLYNGTSSLDYDNFVSYLGVVSCTLMTNGTWKLRSTAFNYLTLITTKESGQPLPTTASILANVDIESSIQDQTSKPANSGMTNLTVWHSGSRLPWTPSNVSVSGGKSNYLWDISLTTSQNGLHSMEVFWCNGTEAGYLSKGLVVYYPTSLNADDYVIDALTEDNFFVRVNYDNTFTPRGLNSTYASVKYSFNSEANASMNDDYNNGTWTKTVSTSGRTYGTYLMKVYAEGYALQNQSITITINLVHETQPLSASWMSNSIDWTQTAILSINYTLQNGTLIRDATQKDVYINGTLYSLNGTNGTYWIQIDNTFGLGHHSVMVNISRAGYRPRTLSGITFDANLAVTGLTDSWQPSNMTITFTQSLNLTVHYTHDGGDVSPSAIVNVTVSGHTYNLTYVAGAWRVSVPGKDIGLGVHSATIRASVYGYQYMTTVTSGLNVTVASNSLISVARSTVIGGYSSSVLYNDGWAIVSVRIEDMESRVITTGSVNLTIDARTYSFTLQPSDNFTVTLQARYFGVGLHSGIIHVYAYGYQEKTSPLSLVVAPVPAHISVTQGQVPSVMFLNQTTVFVLEYLNNHTTARIPNAGIAYFTWPNGIVVDEITPGRFRITIDSFTLSLTSHMFNITLGHANYTVAGIQAYITVRSVLTHLTTEMSFAQYENETVSIWANYTDSDHAQPIHWASVNVTIEGVVYHMTHSGSGIYTVNFRITLIQRSTPYVVSITALAAGCSSNATTSDLYVRAKAFVYVRLGFEGSPVEGNSIKISAFLKHNVTDEPVEGALIRFEAAAVYVNGSRQNFLDSYLTNANGEASWAFNIPVSTLSAVDHLEIVATYSGATSTWPANKTLQIKVTLGTMALLVIFLTSTEGILLMACIVGATVAVTFNQKMRKPKKMATRRALEHELRDFKDLGTLRHFIAVYLNRGTCVFYHPFTESRIQADLISGFISAITSVYGEIKGNGVQGTLEEIHYHGLILNSYSGKFVIGMLILEGELTPLLKDRLQYFVERFEDQYQDILEEWNGQTEAFDPEWIVSNLIAAFNFNWVLPHRLSPQKKMSGSSRKVLRILGSRLDEKGEFLIGDVIGPVAKAVGRTEPEVFDYLLRLEEKGLIVPITISTVLQRQGMALVDKEVCAAGEVPVTLGEFEVIPPKAEEPESRPEVPRIEMKLSRSSGKEQAAPVEQAAPTEEEPEVGRVAPPTQVELKPEEQFLAEVEKLLLAERDRKERAAQDVKKKRKDEAENFIEDVERLLSSDKKDNED